MTVKTARRGKMALRARMELTERRAVTVKTARRGKMALRARMELTERRAATARRGGPGQDGADGAPGSDGQDGDYGWTPVLAIVTSGERRVQRVVGWTGGTGDEPDVGVYVGSDGFESNIDDAVDIRGEQGEAGADAVFEELLEAINGLSLPSTGSKLIKVTNAGVELVDASEFTVETTTTSGGVSTSTYSPDKPLAFRTKSFRQPAVLIQRPGDFDEGGIWQESDEDETRTNLLVVTQPVMEKRDNTANVARLQSERVFYVESDKTVSPIVGGTDPRLADQFEYGGDTWTVSRVECWASYFAAYAYRQET